LIFENSDLLLLFVEDKEKLFQQIDFHSFLFLCQNLKLLESTFPLCFERIQSRCSLHLVCLWRQSPRNVRRKGERSQSLGSITINNKTGKAPDLKLRVSVQEDVEYLLHLCVLFLCFRQDHRSFDLRFFFPLSVSQSTPFQRVTAFVWLTKSWCDPESTVSILMRHVIFRDKR